MVEGQACRRRPYRSGGSYRTRTIQGAILAGLVLVAGAAVAEPCAPWPGEPSPLPRVDDRDEMLQRWARLRVRELEAAASELEADAPLRAHHLWRRVLCLDAANDAAVAGLARTPLVVVHEPALVTRDTQEDVGDAWAALSRPLRVRQPQVAPPTPAPAPAPAATGAADFEARLEVLEQQVRSARFEEALVGIAELRDDAASSSQGARVDVLAATAALALGRDAEAEAHLSRALAADPGLVLDPVTTPPKVRRALDRVRAEQGR